MFVSNSLGEDERTLCGGVGDAEGKEVVEIVCERLLIGRFVTVTKPSQTLTLCEVKVMGSLVRE